MIIAAFELFVYNHFPKFSLFFLSILRQVSDICSSLVNQEVRYYKDIITLLSVPSDLSIYFFCQSPQSNHKLFTANEALYF